MVTSAKLLLSSHHASPSLRATLGIRISATHASGIPRALISARTAARRVGSLSSAAASISARSTSSLRASPDSRRVAKSDNAWLARDVTAPPPDCRLSSAERSGPSVMDLLRSHRGAGYDARATHVLWVLLMALAMSKQVDSNLPAFAAMHGDIPELPMFVALHSFFMRQRSPKPLAIIA